MPDLLVDLQEESSFRLGPLFDHVEKPGAWAGAHEEPPGSGGLGDEDVVAEPDEDAGGGLGVIEDEGIG